MHSYILLLSGPISYVPSYILYRIYIAYPISYIESFILYHRFIPSYVVLIGCLVLIGCRFKPHHCQVVAVWPLSEALDMAETLCCNFIILSVLLRICHILDRILDYRRCNMIYNLDPYPYIIQILYIIIHYKHSYLHLCVPNS